MKSILIAALLIGVATPAAAPAVAPGCHVTARASPAPGLDAAFNGVPFRYLIVRNDAAPCPVAYVRLANYGGRYAGESVPLPPGAGVIFGPVPLYRTAERVLPSGKVFPIPIS